MAHPHIAAGNLVRVILRSEADEEQPEDFTVDADDFDVDEHMELDEWRALDAAAYEAAKAERRRSDHAAGRGRPGGKGRG